MLRVYISNYINYKQCKLYTFKIINTWEIIYNFTSNVYIYRKPIVTPLPGGKIFRVPVSNSLARSFALAKQTIARARSRIRLKRWRRCRVAKCLHFNLYTQLFRQSNIFLFRIALCAIYLQLKFVYA